MDPQEKQARISLASKAGNQKALAYLKYYGSARKALAEDSQLSLVATENPTEQFHLPECIVFGEAQYPHLLSLTNDAPMVLYFKGDFSLLNTTAHQLAIVGTRKISSYGSQAAQALTREAVLAGVITISGMAFGTDTIVHKTTLENGGKTIAVLGTGVDRSYPETNRWLYDRIINEGGLILSEYSHCEEYNKWVFPRRNRIIAGLAEATLIIEAPLKSGALITGRLAGSYQRPVFAVPGNIFAESLAGNLQMLTGKEAEPCRCITDIFPDAIQNYVNKSADSSLNFEQQQLINALNPETNLVGLQKELHWDERKLIKSLTELELMGLVEVTQGVVRRYFGS